MFVPLWTVVETPEFVARAKSRMTAEERSDFIDYVAADPKAGDVMAGTGGARKVRWRGRGKGKSGGVRVITFHPADDLPVFLLTVFGKGEKSNLNKTERNELKAILSEVADEYRKGLNT